MPFVKRIAGLVTPKRVYSLCKLAKCGKYSKAEVKSLLEPESLIERSDNDNDADKFTQIFNFAKAGELVREESGKVYCNLESSELESFDSFRKALSKRIFKDSEQVFCRFTAWYMARGKNVFEDTKEDLESTFYNEVTSLTGDKNEFNETNIEAWKTWVCFLGLGFLVSDSKVAMRNTIVIPNAAVRIKDCIEDDIKSLRGRKMPVRKFIDWLKFKCPELDYGKIFIKNKGSGGLEENHLSVAVSSGLRFLHDRKVLTLENIPDASDIWYLESSGGHEMSFKVTDIVIGG